jgi:siroheme synthase
LVTAPLDAIAGRAAKAYLPGPAIIIAGSVVTLRERLSWFKSAGV